MISESCPRCGSHNPKLQRVGREVCSHKWHKGADVPDPLPVTTVARRGDPAQFVAAPIDATIGPRVYLLSINPDPLGSIAAACKMYKGEVVRDLSEVTDAERVMYLGEMRKTKLQAPLEFVNFHFLLEGVTRSFTHQLVRQRTAVYAQESLRFAVKEDLENSVGLPPSLADTELLVDYEYGPDELAGAQGQRGVWDRAIGAVAEAYDELIESGMPAEDARGILPHAVLTRVHYSCDLRALLDHAGNRLCTQAQFEWRAVFTRIVEAIRDSDAYMAGELADLFRPVCYQIGKCAFGADFDRHCDIRERVQVRAENGGADSTQWHKPFLYHEYDPVTGLPRGIESPGIAPYEWLGNPDAARPT